jgi:hypothetical protein
MPSTLNNTHKLKKGRAEFKTIFEYIVVYILKVLTYLAMDSFVDSV